MVYDHTLILCKQQCRNHSKMPPHSEDEWLLLSPKMKMKSATTFVFKILTCNVTSYLSCFWRLCSPQVIVYRDGLSPTEKQCAAPTYRISILSNITRISVTICICTFTKISCYFLRVILQIVLKFLSNFESKSNHINWNS